jgi:Na+/melibiose symporter-like transporter
MDCQLLMNTFNAFYYFSFIAGTAQSVDKILFLASQLTTENQVLLWQELGKQLGQGL